MLNPMGFKPFLHLQDSPGFKTVNVPSPSLPNLSSPPHWRLGSFKGLHGAFEDQIAPLQCQKKKRRISGAVKYVLANSYLRCVLSKLLPSRKGIRAKQVPRGLGCCGQSLSGGAVARGGVGPPQPLGERRGDSSRGGGCDAVLFCFFFFNLFSFFLCFQ